MSEQKATIERVVVKKIWFFFGRMIGKAYVYDGEELVMTKRFIISEPYLSEKLLALCKDLLFKTYPKTRGHDTVVFEGGQLSFVKGEEYDDACKKAQSQIIRPGLIK